MTTKVKVYEGTNKVPKYYNKYLKSLGLLGGALRDVYFYSPDDVHHVSILTNENDIPLAWGIICRDGWYGKSIMLYTNQKYRKMGYGARVFNSLKKLHKRFSVYNDGINSDFFRKMGRRVSF